MDQNSIAEYAILQLTELRDRTSMLLPSTDDLNAAAAYMTGLRAGLAYFGLVPNLEHVRRAIQSRGWTWGATAPEREMRARLMSGAEIVKELIEIEIVCWSLYAIDDRASAE